MLESACNFEVFDAFLVTADVTNLITVIAGSDIEK